MTDIDAAAVADQAGPPVDDQARDDDAGDEHEVADDPHDDVGAEGRQRLDVTVDAA